MEYSGGGGQCPLLSPFLIEIMKTLLLLLLASGSAMAADDASLLHCRALSDAGQRLACYDALSVGSPGQPVRAAAPTAKAIEQSFGLEAKQAPLQSFVSAIPGKFEGLAPNQQIVLANGQVWRIIDDSNASVSGINLKVKVERNFLGTVFMTIEGTNAAPRVKRIK